MRIETKNNLGQGAVLELMGESGPATQKLKEYLEGSQQLPPEVVKQLMLDSLEERAALREAALPGRSR